MIADTHERAAKLEKEAEQLRAQIQPPDLSEVELEEIRIQMTPFAKSGFLIASPRNDLESQRLALLIMSALKSPGMGADKDNLIDSAWDQIAKYPPFHTGVFGGYTPDPTVFSGVEVWGTNANAVQTLISVLKPVSAQLADTIPAELSDSKIMPVAVFVGLKPMATVKH